LKKQEEVKTNEMANPEESAEYNPRADEHWWQTNFNYTYPQVQKFKFTLIEIAIFIVVVALVAAVAVPIRSGIVVDSKWSEAKTAMGTIKAAVDQYSANNNGDISGLDEPKGSLKYGFVSGSNLLFKLKLEDTAFESLQYFDAEDFSLEFTTDGKDGSYIITVTSQKGGGNSGIGPEGIIIYNSDTNEWKEDH